MEPIVKKLSVKQKRVKSAKKINKKTSTQGKSEKNTGDEDQINLPSDDESNSSQDEAVNEVNVSKVVKVPESVPKLYIRFKKTIKALSKTSADLIAMHPLIKSVRLPRQKENSKFFFAVCQSEEKALKAAKDLRERKDCFVKPAFKVSKKESTKPVSQKSKLRYFWQ